MSRARTRREPRSSPGNSGESSRTRVRAVLVRVVPQQFSAAWALPTLIALVTMSDVTPLAGQTGPTPAVGPSSSPDESNRMTVARSDFGTTSAGQTAHRFDCVNRHGLRLVLTDYGAIVVAVEVPDREGKLANITLGFDSLAGYLQRHPYFGATVGRYCNRIAKGEFTLNGKAYTLATNNGPNHLHGGIEGFDRQMWDAEPITTANEVGVRFRRLSPAGEEGYPGNLQVSATYTLNNQNELKLEFDATTDAPTVANLTNHCYWNLAGAGQGNILNHQLTLAADQYLAVDESLIPTGEMASVEGTPLDFRAPHAVGERIDQLAGEPGGYDHCFVLRPEAGKLRLAARVSDPATGRVMEILTTQPGIQFYSGNFLDGSESAGGFAKHDAFCLETQHFPDSPNHPTFPSTLLKPGETLHEVTVHRFSVQ